MNNNKSVKLLRIENYLRDINKGGLYDAFEYIGDSISTQDLIMAEQDSLYLDYLVVEVMSVIYVWSDTEIDKMIEHIGVKNV